MVMCTLKLPPTYIFNIYIRVIGVHTTHSLVHYTLCILYYIMCVEQIGKRGISFSGSQYGSCSTTYNTLPVTKVVYN